MTAKDTSTNQVSPRKLTELAVAPGQLAVATVDLALRLAMDGTGPAIAPIPVGNTGLATNMRQSLRPDDDEYPLESSAISVVCPTSGSTEYPRGVLLSADALQASATAFGQRFGSDHRWVVTLPVHRIAGIMTLVRAYVHGSDYVVDPSIGGAQPFRADTFIETTKQALRFKNSSERPLAVSLVPTQLARLVDAGSDGIAALNHYDVVLSGASATPQPLLMRLREAGVNVVISYGMSETCGGCVFDGRPLDGVGVTLSSRDEVDPGRITISGPVLASGYRLRPDVDAVTFIDGSLHTHDVGRIDSGGLLHVLGRLDDIVMVGGVNVSLSAVESILRHHDQIQEVAVIDYTDELWGALPIACIVPKHEHSDFETLSDEVKTQVGQRIGRAATPRLVVYLQQLPMLDSGKVDRIQLRLNIGQDIAEGRLPHPGVTH